MPAITATSIFASGVLTLTETTLNGTDTFTYETGDILTLRNPTVGALSPTIDGAGGTTWDAEGIGVITVSAGYAVGSIGIGAARVIPLDSIRAYCQGAVSITGGTGLVASILRH